LKILHVVPFFPPAWAWGGPVITSYEICKGFQARGHQITVYTTDSLDANNRINVPTGKPILFEGLEVYYFRNTSNWLAGKHHLQFSPGLINVAQRDIKNFDVVHLHGYRTFQNMMVYSSLRKYKVPYLLHAQGTLPNISPKQGLKTIYDLFGGQNLIRNAAACIAMTEEESEQYKKMGARQNKIEIVPTGIDLTKFKNLPRKGNFRQKYGIRNNAKLILYLGRIHESKGVDVLIRAFISLTKEMNDAQLAIVGPDDGYLSHLLNIVNESKIDPTKLLFTGPLYGSNKLEAYVDADIYVLPSYYEPYGLSVLEACACGTPVITTNTSPISRLTHDIAGYAVPYDALEFKNILIQILNKDDLRKRFGEQARIWVNKNFGWEDKLTCIEHICSRMIILNPNKHN
jgi:glycosyltransferase involved in cell wall biosynthesis